MASIAGHDATTICDLCVNNFTTGNIYTWIFIFCKQEKSTVAFFQPAE